MRKNDDSSRNRILRIRLAFIKRCYNPKDKSYFRYGGRGIQVCDEWLNDKESFYVWAKNNNYRDDLSIDRIDNNGNYEPNNCRWVDKVTQCNNRRSNHIVDRKGEKRTIKEWSDITGIKSETIRARLKNGWNVDDALTKIPRKSRDVIKIYDGRNYHTIAELSRIYDIPKYTIRKRYLKNLPFEEIINTDYIRGNDESHKRYYYQNQYYTLKEISDLTGVCRRLIYDRVINYKMTVEEAINTPLKKVYKNYEYEGVTYKSLKDLCDKYGVNHNTVRGRMIRLNESLEEAMNIVVGRKITCKKQ